MQLFEPYLASLQISEGMAIMKQRVKIVYIFFLITIAIFCLTIQELLATILCEQLFPSNCIVGGCNAEPGWYTGYCVIYCSEISAIVCRPPGWYF